MEDFSGKVAVITGGASGIGLALAKRFVDDGMKVVLADIEQSALDAAAVQLGGADDVIAVRTDVRSAESVDALADETYRRFGATHLLCNNAGVQRSASTWQLSMREWDWVMGVNFYGVVHGIRSFVPRMLEQGDEGHVVNTASFGGLVYAPMMSAYGASKAAVVAVTESLALELNGTKVGASVLCPGFVQTRLGDADRNMPEGLEEGLGEDDVAQRRAISQGAAGLIDGGIETGVVVDAVVDAIRAGQLYVLTHPNYMGAFKRRADSILAAGRRDE